MEYVLETRNLTKIYTTRSLGRIKAVNNLNIKIKKSSVFGFLGPNGSGKTTTLAMLLSIVNPNSGSFTWFSGEDNSSARKKIGAILEGPNFYPNMSAYNNLKLVALIKKVSKSRITEVLNIVGLENRKNDKFKTFSLGMKQRLSIASALLSDPEVLVLDEPTNGLDPKGISDIRKIIKDIAKLGKTVILASHLLDEVQKVCDEFIILRKGKLIYEGRVEDDFSDYKMVRISSENLEILKEIISKHKDFISLEEKDNKLNVKFNPQSDINDIARFIFENKIVINHFEELKKTLEDRFLDILEER